MRHWTSSSYHILVCFEAYSPIIEEAIEGAFKVGCGMGAKNGRELSLVGCGALICILNPNRLSKVTCKIGPLNSSHNTHSANYRLTLTSELGNKQTYSLFAGVFLHPKI